MIAYMKVFVLGNEDIALDNRVFGVTKKLKNIDWQVIDINQDIPVNDDLIIVDTIDGIDRVTVFDEKVLDKLIGLGRVTAHDYDLGFQLKYLKKLGKLKKVTIIGIPQIGKIDYDLIQSIFKKLVAQDIQGS